MKKYDEELKTKVIRLHLQEGRSQKSLEEEYNLGRGAIYYWLKSYSKECQTNPEKAAEKQRPAPPLLEPWVTRYLQRLLPRWF